ncbi:MAG: glycosyltransferase family 1 protein [Gammaproteobacteria bacterium]|nr:MAG: glycosyltransferase family 1 protein [Gammaproteobacteria bacterium]
MLPLHEDPMKIVHVETGRHFYGGAQQVIWLIKGLTGRGVENMLVCPADSDIDRVARDAAIPVRNLRCSGDLDFRFAWRLGKLVAREKPDVVHCHSRRGADFLGGQTLALTGVPAVLSRRVDHTESRLLARWRYRPFRKVIAISGHIATVLEDGGMHPDRLATIRSAVDLDSINTLPDCAAFRNQFKIDDDDFVIAMVAQFIPRKGHRYLFDVIPNLRDSHPNIRVLLFGSGPQEAELHALATRLNLHGTVQFAGFRENLDDFLACIDLLVHPATQEGLGVAMLKAAAAGVPVLAFDTAGSREAVAHGKTGVLVPCEDVATLQKAIAVLIDEPGMRHEFGAAGRQRMQDEFSMDTMVGRHIKLYESVING